MTESAKDETANYADFMEFAGKVFEVAGKLKSQMLKRGLTSAKAKCPMCSEGYLHGRLVGRKNHMRMWCDICKAQLME